MAEHAVAVAGGWQQKYAREAPCDDCRFRARCAATGEACSAFAHFYDGRPWVFAARQPNAKIGARILCPELA